MYKSLLESWFEIHLLTFEFRQSIVTVKVKTKF